MIGNLIVHVSPVESCFIQARKLVTGSFRLLGEALAGGIVRGLDIQFLHQRQSLIVHRRMVANHLLCKGADIVIFRLVQGLPSGLDVGIGDMGKSVPLARNASLGLSH